MKRGTEARSKKKKVRRAKTTGAGAARPLRAAARRVEGAARALRRALDPVGEAERAPTPVRARRPRRAAPAAVQERLARAIARPHVELAFDDAWRLLIAVILSAQSTDRRVNQVTPDLFRRWSTPAALAAAEPAEVEEVIKSTGFFRNKTKAIIGASATLMERFGGQVPRSMPEMLELPGVARKTANVVLGAAHGVASGIVVDTHAARVAQRLGLTKESTPEKIEAALCSAFEREHWISLSHRLVLHGRYVCTARAPACSACPLNELCPARLAPGEGSWEERAAAEERAMQERAEGFARV